MSKKSQSGDEPVTIKKYANRRLYNTSTSTYVTLEDLGEMVKAGADFVVFDAKTGEDITRSVLTQIIFEEESKQGQSLLPIRFLRQLIRFYGDSMQQLVPSYLEFSMESLIREQEKFRRQMAQALGGHPFEAMEEQVRQNMAMYEQAFAMFSPFRPPEQADKGEAEAEAEAEEGAAAEEERGAKAGNSSGAKPAKKAAGEDLDALREQLATMQKQLDSLAGKK